MGANLESIELHVRITMGQSLDQTLDNFFGAIWIARDLVAHFDDGAPVLGGEILIGSSGWNMTVRTEALMCL